MLNEAYTIKHFSTTEVKPGEPIYLSMLIGAGSFMYAVSTQQFTSVTELCHIQLNDEQMSSDSLKDRVAFLVQNYFLDRKKFEKVNIAFLNTDFAMVPAGYAEQDSLKALLKFTVGEAPVKNILQHTVNGARFCYVPDAELAMYLERAFPNAAVKHAGAISIQLLAGHHALKSADLFLQVHDQLIELAAKNKNELLYYNVFNYSNNEDILYYLLFMMEQFNLDPLTVKLGIAAQRPADDELIKSIKRYIKKVELCVHDPSVTLNGEMQQLPAHYYFILLNQHTCEL